jgi:hypothetical protein
MKCAENTRGGASMVKSIGRCEVCGRQELCYDVRRSQKHITDADALCDAPIEGKKVDERDVICEALASKVTGHLMSKALGTFEKALEATLEGNELLGAKLAAEAINTFMREIRVAYGAMALVSDMPEGEKLLRFE